MQKPSVKNIILIASAAIIIGAAFAVSKYENTNYYASADTTATLTQLPIITIATTSTTDASNLQSSGDWQKTLSTSVSGAWGTSSSTKIASSAPLTATDIFGQKLFSLYSQAQNAGNDVTDPSVQQAIVGQVLTDGTILPGPKQFTLNDLKISPDNSIAALTTYGNQAALAYVENYIKHNGELDIVQASFDNNDPTILKQLDPIIAEYQATLKGELQVTVPSSMQNFHLKLVNAFNELLFADQEFEKTYSDGLTSLNGIKIYQQGTDDLTTALTGIESSLSLANITYPSNEPGVIFINKAQ